MEKENKEYFQSKQYCLSDGSFLYSFWGAGIQTQAFGSRINQNYWTGLIKGERLRVCQPPVFGQDVEMLSFHWSEKSLPSYESLCLPSFLDRYVDKS